MSGWNGEALIREAFKNLTAQPGRTVILLAIALGGLLSVSLGELYTARGVENRTRSLIAQGYTTVKVGADPDGIPAKDCARLQGQQGVLAAGGVGTVSTVVAGSSPGLGFWEAPSAGNVIGALTGTFTTPTARPGLLLSTDLADQLGVRVGSYLNIGGKPQRVAGIFPFGQRDELLGRIALVPAAPAGMLQACYVQFAAGDYTAGATALTGAFGGLANVTIEGLIARGPGATNPATSWNERSTRFAWLAAGIVLGAVGLLTARSRYHELSVYVLTGSWRSEVAAMYLCEIALILGLAALSSIAWTSFLTVLSHAGWEPFHAALVGLSRTMLLAAAMTPLGLVPLFRRDLARLLRERAS
jgi:predicted lysophospholipase L1 biosynthesis ABC-type transport system permease subunit